MNSTARAFNSGAYHIEADNLSVRLLDFAELHEEVPETRFRDHGVWCEDTHAVEFRSRVGISWQVAANDLVFCETTYYQNLSVVFLHQ